MRKLSLLFLLLLLPLPVAALCEKPLRLNIGDWPPYMYPLPEGDAGGVDVDTVKRMARRLGCQLEFTQVPPERAHPMLEAGEIDILMAASDRPERRRYARFSAAYRNEVMAVLAPGTLSRPPLEMAALARGKLRLLAPRFGWYGQDYDQRRPQLVAARRLDFYDTYEQGVAMLVARRGDLLLGDEQALQHVAGKQGLALRRLFISNSSPVHLMFSRARFSEADMARINAALAPAGKGPPGGSR